MSPSSSSLPERRDNADAEAYRRSAGETRRALDSSAAARENSRASRLRLRLDLLAMRCHSRPPFKGNDSDQLLGEVLDSVMESADAPRGNIQFLDADTQSLKIRVQRGFERPFLDFFSEVHPGAACCGTTLANGTPTVVEDVRTSPLFSEDSRAVMIEARALACQSVPLIVAGRKIGVISVHYEKSGISLARQEALAALGSRIAEVVAMLQ